MSKCSKKEVKLESSASLIKTTDIKELYLAKYKWSGIAAHYSKGENPKVDTYIRYDAEVRAKINLENINENIIINKDSKKITITLPKIEFDITPLFEKDGKKYSFIPRDTKIEPNEVLATCKEDAERKIKERVEMLETAKTSAKNTIQSYLQPLVEDNYKIEWKDGE